MSAFGIKDSAMPAWVSLADALQRLEDEGRPPICQGPDRDMWSSETTGDRVEAAAACTWCLVADRCLLFAVANGERHGIWGGQNFNSKPGRTAAELQLENQ